MKFMPVDSIVGFNVRAHYAAVSFDSVRRWIRLTAGSGCHAFV